MAVAHEKLRNLILFIGTHAKVAQLGLTKLNKLIYYSDVIALRELGHSTTGSDYIKYDHGLVPSRGEKFIKELKKEGAIESRIVDLGKSAKMNRIKSLRSAETKHFSQPELEIMDRVCSVYGPWKAKALSDLSHREPALAAAGKLDKPYSGLI